MTVRALAAAREAGDPWSEAYALAFSAVQEAERGEFARSRQLGLEARDRETAARPLSECQPLGLASRVLAYSALQAGELDQAGGTFEETIAFLREAGEVWALGIILSDLAALRVIQGRLGEAEACANEALAFCRSLRDRYLTLSRDAIGEPAFREAYDAGRTTPISRIMDRDGPAFS